MEDLGGARTQVDSQWGLKQGALGLPDSRESGSSRGRARNWSTPESRFADSQISAAIYVILGDRSSYLYRVVKNLKTAHRRDD